MRDGETASRAEDEGGQQGVNIDYGLHGYGLHAMALRYAWRDGKNAKRRYGKRPCPNPDVVMEALIVSAVG